MDWIGAVYAALPYQGSFYIDLDGNSPGEISTNIATVPGVTYTLGFAYAKNPDAVLAAQAEVLINGSRLAALAVNVSNSVANPNWQTTSFVFTATSPTTLLAFNSLDSPGDTTGLFLDAVSLTASAVSGDALQFINASNIIADHISAEWSPRQDTSAFDSANLTVQWSMIADGLYSTNVNGGSLLRFGNGALSFHHNLYANNFSGSPHLGDGLSLDFVNNVIYGWGTNAGFTLNEGVTNQLNYVCNYLIANSNSFAPTIAFRGGTTNTWIFQTNNFIDSNTNGILDGANTSWAMFTNQFTKIGQPFPLAPVSTDEAYKAYERVLDFAGLSLMARDAVDTNTVTGVRNQTGTIITASGALPAIISTLPPLDSDQDGIPDYWETTFGQNPTNASSSVASPRAIGYTDLEEYINWLGAPHALTITNTPVGVDLYKLCGNSGSLSFFLTNAVNGTVYLTNVLNYTNSLGVVTAFTNTGPFSNSIAVFTPTTSYSGYAAFDFYVTNNATVAYFGPVTVSVVVSSVPISYGAVNTNAPVFLNGNPSSQTNDELTTLTVTNTATVADTNLTLSYVVTMAIDTNAMILNGWPLTYATTTPSPVIDANGIITWTPTEAQGPGVYIITTVVTDSSIPSLSATNSFSVTVNESNTPPFWPPNVPSQTNYNVSALATLVVTNTAMDSDIPPNPLTYTLSVSPNVTNAVIDTNGIITWTPGITQVGLFTFTTVVTDTNAYALVNQSLSATNVFTVFVSAAPGPFAFSEPAQSVTGASAQLNGMATPNGLPTMAWFQWGTTTNYGNATPAVPVGSSYDVVYTTNVISGLLTNVPYYFRLVAANAAGTNYGFDQILDEANVVVWGADYVGQANVPAGLSNVVAIAGAYDHSLALKNNGAAVAWGDNAFGQSTVPAGLNNVVAVAGGEYYSMALKNNGTVTAWGANVLGQTNVPVGLNNVVTIAGGTLSSLALKNNGIVVAWGPSFFGLTNVPAGASNAVAVAGGGFHNLAIKNTGTIIGWGDNSAGQLNIPAGLSNVVAIAAGNFHSLALKYDGTVAAWGDNSAGQTNVPAGLNNVVAIAAGGFHSLALKNDGTVVTWGDNSAGQASVPVGLTNVVAIASGYFHSLALTPQSLASLTNPIVLNLAGGVPQTNTIFAGGLTYYRVNVPTNADFATNSLLSAFNGPLNVWFTTNTPPTIATVNDSLLLAGVTNGVSILSTTSAPTNIVPGSTYYLGVNNTNSFAVTYGIEVDFHLVTSTNTLPQTNAVPVSGIIYTNIGGTNGFLLTWFAPSNDLFQVQFTDSLFPANWITFTNIIGYNPNAFVSPTNTQFNFFDDGSQYPFVGLRFYRLILLGTVVPPVNTPPVLPAQTNLTINPLNPLIVTNTATDAQSPPQILTYMLSSTVVGTNQPTINTNTGVITWTPAVSQAGTSNTITTIVTDNGTPNLSAANSFAVIVNPVPSISNVTFTAGGFLLSWWAPTNDFFQVQFTDSLAPQNWLNFSNYVTYTGPLTPTNGLFTFFDNGTEHPFTGLRFYRINLIGVTLPAAPPATNTVPISSIVATNGNFLLTWFAPTTNQFNVQWSTNLVPPATWTMFPGIITSTNGTFTFLDTNAPMLMKFYELILLP